jgi:TolA-binding protein
MTRRGSALLGLLLLAALAVPAAAQTGRGHDARTPRIRSRRAAERPTPRPDEDLKRLDDARTALAQDRIDDARAALAKLLPSRLPPREEEEASYLKALLLEPGDLCRQALEEYLKQFPRGEHHRAGIVALAKLDFANGDYAACENLLSIFSPGVEQDALGREGLVWRGLAELGRGDADGSLQFLQSARKDLDGSSEEEAYYFAVAQAALRSGSPGAAMEALRVLLTRHANGDYAPQALYAMGQALEVSGRPSDAAALFRQVAQRFPETYEAARARDRGIRLQAVEGSIRPPGGGFSVQIGAFAKREGAERLARELRVAGVGDVVVREGRETPPVYRVRAGAFDTRDEARALGERLRRERGLSYTVVTR